MITLEAKDATTPISCSKELVVVLKNVVALLPSIYLMQIVARNGCLYLTSPCEPC